MWASIKKLPLRVKIIGILVLAGLGGIYKQLSEPHSHSGGTYASYSDASSSRQDSEASSASPSSGQRDSREDVLAKLQKEYDSLTNQNAECTAQLQQMNPGNFGPPPCEAQMQWNTPQIAKLEAEITRLKTGANVQPIDFVLMGSGSPSSSGGAASGEGAPSGDHGSDAVNRHSREGILGQSKYTDSQGKEYQLPNRPYYFKDRASGRIEGSDTSEQPDYQHDWEQLTYQPN